MRFALAAVLAVIGAAAVLISVGPLSNLFADYQDSPASTYLLYGLPPLLFGVAALVAAWQVLKA
jgi:chromate transport protein ChrA